MIAPRGCDSVVFPAIFPQQLILVESMRVLILEDDSVTANLLSQGFSAAGYKPEICVKGDDAIESASNENFDLMVVDIMVPGTDGLSVVEELRGRGRNVPVLFLSAKRSLEDRLAGLQRGGDDYLTKPFSFSEVLARCQAILRRSAKPQETHRLVFQDVEMDLFKRTVKKGAKVIDLQSKEFALLEYLMRNPGQVLTKTQILEKVWNYNFDPQTNVVDVLVCRLRNKLERELSGMPIETIRGVGYVLRTH
jgi:two-component system OmpR family response regulator